jgi:uncharacterized protein YodC (DUF2158 family)
MIPGDTVSLKRGQPMTIVEIRRNGIVVCTWSFAGTQQIAAFDWQALVVWRKGMLN